MDRQELIDRAALIASAFNHEREMTIMDALLKMAEFVISKQESPWHPYPAEKPPQIRPEISTNVLAHVPWGECCSCYYKDGEWKGCPDLWAKKIDKWMEIPE